MHGASEIWNKVHGASEIWNYAMPEHGATASQSSPAEPEACNPQPDAQLVALMNELADELGQEPYATLSMEWWRLWRDERRADNELARFSRSGRPVPYGRAARIQAECDDRLARLGEIAAAFGELRGRYAARGLLPVVVNKVLRDQMWRVWPYRRPPRRWPWSR